MFECGCCSYLLAALLFLLIGLNVSTTFHYYTRISFFYVCILLHGIECNITMIPSYLLNKGADYIFSSFYYWCLWTGINVEVRGYDEHLRHLKGPAVVICNHQSAIDVVTMTHVFPPRGTVMMKRSLQYIPFFNVASWLCNAIFIDRFNKERAMEQMEYCAKELVKRDLKLWIFPEGTRFRSQGMLPFKKGAFNIAIKGQIPIVPIVSSNISPFYSKTEKYFRTDGEVIAQVLPPVSTEGLTSDDVVQLSDRIREDMLKVYDRNSAEAAEKMAAKRAKKTA